MRSSHYGILALLASSALCVSAMSCSGRTIQQSRAASRVPDVVFVPTPHAVVDRMLSVARVGKDDVLYDLGSGDGRIVIAAAKRFAVRAVGIDIDPNLVAASRRNADTAGVAALVEFREADLFTIDLRPASVVTLYLLSELNVRLRPKLFNELRPGSRVVSHSFDMGDWKADSTLMVENRFVFFWTIPANVVGMWNIIVQSDGAERRYRVRLDQKYQVVTATAPDSAAGISVGNAVVRGERVSFTIRDSSGATPLTLTFDGRLDGAVLSGLASDGSGNARKWRATRS
ncbi:MAG TPA: class I SAM-dependent methyltransferase [Gemmatimonadaceae bacterium]|nr:class I SAM-dependent methyltransferase [Gemmatimonadaceae bacterium]